MTIQLFLEDYFHCFVQEFGGDGVAGLHVRNRAEWVPNTELGLALVVSVKEEQEWS